MTSELANTESQPLAIISQALQRGVDAEQLGKLLDLQERFERNQAAKQFAEAITGFQRDCPQIAKIKEGAKGAYHYAPFEEIDRVARPFMAKHNIVPTFDTSTDDKGFVTVTCHIRVGTHQESSSIRLPPLQGNAMVNGAQLEGQRLMYGKRYALCAALNIVTRDEDDDAHRPLEFITAEQLKAIDDLVEACDLAGNTVDQPKFLNWLGVAKIEELPAAKYQQCVSFLQRKRDEKKGRK